jgi:hypothetical protein
LASEYRLGKESRQQGGNKRHLFSSSRNDFKSPAFVELCMCKKT